MSSSLGHDWIINPNVTPCNMNLPIFCREQSLPDDIKQGTSVKKGTVIAFTKDDQSYIHARANEHSLVEVQSQKLAQAVFDIYLGAQVCSQE